MTRRSFPSPTSPVRRRLAGAAAALAVAAAAVFAVAAPASAHDQLVSTSPADGATVSALPPSVTLTFSDVVVAGGANANQVKVFDASCTPLQKGVVNVQDNVVTQKLDATDVTGPVHVLWRVVSQDGHPVSGDFTFTVGAASASTTATPARCSDAADAAKGDPQTQSTSALPWIATGGALVLVIAGVGVLLVTRSRRAGDR